MAFSATHSAAWSENRKFISAGASVPGVSWNSIVTPSRTSTWPVWVMSRVGAMRPICPSDVAWPSPQPIWPGRAPLQVTAVHVDRAAGHGGAGVDVLGHGVGQEPLGGEDGDVAAVDRLLVDDTLDPAEVVDVAVGVDDGSDGPIATVFPVEGEGRRRRLHGDERVDHDHAGVALDDGHVREVETPHLVDALGHLEQALDAVQPGLAPQARVCGRGTVLLEEPVAVVVPDHPARLVVDDPWLQCGDEAPSGVFEVLGVVERKVGVDVSHGPDHGPGRAPPAPPTMNTPDLLTDQANCTDSAAGPWTRLLGAMTGSSASS